ncbi:MAG: hypothetical protein HY719_02385 [Planctomycetes bacterium]|nr:hypothetical protein [Planctomycetota bacterium]
MNRRGNDFRRWEWRGMARRAAMVVAAALGIAVAGVSAPVFGQGAGAVGGGSAVAPPPAPAGAGMSAGEAAATGAAPGLAGPDRNAGMILEAAAPERFDYTFRTRRVSIPYKAMDDTQVRAAELWVDAGGRGERWTLVVRQDPATAQPLVYEERQDGVFGYLIRVQGGGAKGDFSEPEPERLQRARGYFLVDSIPPRITLKSPNRTSYEPGATVTVEWMASDVNLSRNAVVADYTTDGGRTWNPIEGGKGQTAVGSLAWPLPTGVFPEIVARVAAVDNAGNYGEALSTPFSVGFTRAPGVTGASGSGRQLSVAIASTPEVIGSRDFTIFYTVDNATSSALRHVILYYKVWKGGRSGEWTEYGRDPDISDVGASNVNARPSMRFVIPEQVFSDRAESEQFAVGLYLLGVLEDGSTSAPQPTGAAEGKYLPPMQWVNVDNKKPFLELHHPQGGEEFVEGEKVIIEWYSADRNLGKTPVALYLPRDFSAPQGADMAADRWQLLADNLPAEGVYIWKAPNTQFPHVRVRVTARDEVGNVTERVSQPFAVVGRKAMAARQAEGQVNAKTQAEEHYRTARYHIGQHQDQRAMDELQTAVMLWPQFVDAWVTLGTLQYYANDFSAARDSYERALTAGGDSGKVNYYLGLAYERMAEPHYGDANVRDAMGAKAEHHFTRAAEMGPTDQRSRAALAKRLLASNQRTAAEKYLDEIEQIDKATYWGRWAAEEKQRLARRDA